MAVSTLSSPPLPAVERRAVMPGGFLAGGCHRRDQGLGSTGPRPHRRDRRSASAAAVFTPNAFAAAPVKLSRANLAATSDDPRGGFGYASAIVSTSGCANAATGAAGDGDQARVGGIVSSTRSASTAGGCSTSRRASSVRACRSIGSRQGVASLTPTAHRRRRRPRGGRGGAAHDRLGGQGRHDVPRPAGGRRWSR